MAGTILKRTCFYDYSGGTIRPHEWCLVVHSELGPMVEVYWPFETNVDNKGNVNDDDWSNEFQRVDEFVQVNDDQLIKSINSGEGTKWMHGGRHYSRTGR